MGLFKKLGSKLKRVVSIKNLGHAVSGNFGAIAKDAVRVATTNAPAKGVPSTVDKTFLKPDFQIPAPVMQVVESQGKAFGQKVASVVASQPVTQEVSSFFTKVYLESLYTKYKTWIMVLFGLIASFILYKVLKKDSRPQRGSRARR